MNRLRTISKAYEEIKRQDPDTCISRWFLRQLITGGAIPATRAGDKWLVDMSDIEAYFSDTAGKVG